MPAREPNTETTEAPPAPASKAAPPAASPPEGPARPANPGVGQSDRPTPGDRTIAAAEQSYMDNERRRAQRTYMTPVER